MYARSFNSNTMYRRFNGNNYNYIKAVDAIGNYPK